MRLFVYEHICASDSLSPLRMEGWAMLAALVDDFQRMAGGEVWTMLDHRCPDSLGDKCWRVRPEEREDRFRALAEEADGTLVIAPETGGILAQLARTVIASKGRWLGCSLEAIELTTDKKMLAEHWLRHAVPTPELTYHAAYPGFPVVLKPRDGAGSQATFLILDRESWDSRRRQADQEMPGSEFLVQRFVEGQSASVAFLIGPRGIVPLIPATQLLSDDGRFQYLGGELPLAPHLARRAASLGQRAVECVPGLLGYVGVDLILGNDERDDVAIEINPRLTTSYLGLRRLAQQNLANAIYEVVQGRHGIAASWHKGPVRFKANGDCSP